MSILSEWQAAASLLLAPVFFRGHRLCIWRRTKDLKRGDLFIVPSLRKISDEILGLTAKETPQGPFAISRLAELIQIVEKVDPDQGASLRAEVEGSQTFLDLKIAATSRKKRG